MTRRKSEETNGKLTLEDVRFDDHNANKGTVRGRSMLTRSLQDLGAGRSIVADRNIKTIGGNKTLEVAQEIGLDVEFVHTDGSKLVVVVRDDLDLDDPTDTRARELAYADNRVAELDFQIDALVLEQDLNNPNLHLDWLYSDKEFGAILRAQEPERWDQEPSPDDHLDNTRGQELIDKWGVRPGQLWALGPHRLLCADSTDMASWDRLMDGRTADLAVTSPQYNLGENAKLSFYTLPTGSTKYLDNKDDTDPGAWLDMLTDVTTLTLAHCKYLCLNVQQLAGNKIAFVEYLYAFRDRLADVAIWDKGHAQPAMASNVMNSVFEYLIFLSADRMPNRAINTADFRGDVNNVYQGPPQRDNEYADVHAATYPLHLPEWVISTFTLPRALVVDPFVGTGTTIAAAQRTGRTCYAIDISPQYVAVSLERMSDLEPRLLSDPDSEVHSEIAQPSAIS